MSENIERLEVALRAKGMSVELAAELIGVDKSTFYRKMKKGAHAFTVGEVTKMVENNIVDRESAIQIFLS